MFTGAEAAPIPRIQIGFFEKSFAFSSIEAFSTSHS